MRINSLYFIRFNEETKTFYHERVPFDFNPIGKGSWELWDGDWVNSDEDWDQKMKVVEDVRDCSIEFHKLWEEYASKEDREFTASDVAKAAGLVKAGGFYYQFYTEDIPVDVSIRFRNLLEFFSVRVKGTDKGPVYFWPSSDRGGGYYMTEPGSLKICNVVSLEYVLLFG